MVEGPKALSALHAILHWFNPRAHILHSVQGTVPLAEILNTGRFSLEAASAAPGWMCVLRGEEKSEVDEFGIGSFVFRARRPFHPDRLWAFLQTDWPGLLRSKGFFWLASRHDIAGIWSQAGESARLEPGGFWWAATPQEQWPLLDADERAKMLPDWQEPWGDRRREIVFIGQSLREAALRAALDSCLLTDLEIKEGPRNWASYDDAFDEWNMV